MTLISIVTWVVFGCLAAMWARRRNRSPAAWFCIGAIFGLFGLLLLFILPPFREEEEMVPTLPAQEQPKPLFLPTNDWFYLDGEKQVCGPVGIQELRDLWKQGCLTKTGWVWHETLVQWHRVEKLDLLQETLSSDS